MTTSAITILEPVCRLLGLDPFSAGLQLINATNLAALGSDELAGKLIPTVSLLVVQIDSSHLAGEIKLALSELYPTQWPVKLVRTEDMDGDAAVIEMPLYKLDRPDASHHPWALYVPPVDELTSLRLPETLRYITMRLRRDPDGCPWDRTHTHQSLTRYVIEETYEVVEALEENDMEKLAEELGDLLLQVYLHSEIARQEGEFSIGDVYEHINAKLIRRHPHVFGDIKVDNAGQVAQNWEEIKRQERIKAGRDVQNESVLHGVPLASPSLMVAQEYQKHVARTGFEFSDLQGVYSKLHEELQELQQAQTPAERQEEVGDLLFMVAKLARWLKVDAEEGLRYANRKFRRRFQAMEELARRQGRTLTSYSSQEWRALWQEAKKIT